MTNSHAVHSPEIDARRQMTNLLEAAIAKLPERFRVVFMLREVEGLSVEETAEALQIPREIVKARLVRARRKLQQELDSNLRSALAGTRWERLRCAHRARACGVHSERAQALR